VSLDWSTGGSRGVVTLTLALRGTAPMRTLQRRAPTISGTPMKKRETTVTQIGCTPAQRWPGCTFRERSASRCWRSSPRARPRSPATGTSTIAVGQSLSWTNGGCDRGATATNAGAAARTRGATRAINSRRASLSWSVRAAITAPARARSRWRRAPGGQRDPLDCSGPFRRGACRADPAPGSRSASRRHWRTAVSELRPWHPER
jgi:hypothetical protein